MKEKVTLNWKEQKGLVVLNQVGMGKIVVVQAAEVPGLSLRQVWRLLAAYRKEGAAALAHGNRGRKPYNAFDDNLKGRVLELARSIYAGFNHQHLTKLLAEGEDIILSPLIVRRILWAASIRSPSKRCLPRHRSRRERYPQEGMLL